MRPVSFLPQFNWKRDIAICQNRLALFCNISLGWTRSKRNSARARASEYRRTVRVRWKNL